MIGVCRRFIILMMVLVSKREHKEKTVMAIAEAHAQ
jgi:hypothetical protein